ncbi:MAG: rRNA processing protein RimM [Bacteroidota bacterium]|jgi:16S rRNA processing protein RimM
MDKDACYRLGHIASKYSFKGEVLFKLDTDHPQQYEEMESVFVEIDHDLVPFFLRSARWHRDFLRVALEGVESEYQAEQLIGKSLYRPLTDLPELEGDQFYFHEIIGFTVYDRAYGKVGELIAVNDGTTQTLLVIRHESGSEVLIPFVDPLFDGLNRKEKSLTINAPDGLIGLYVP